MELKNISEQIFFYRTTAGSEIDFVIERQDKIYPIEVKFKELRKKIDERVIENFINKSGKKGTGNVVNMFLNNDNGLVKYWDYRFVKNI